MSKILAKNEKDCISLDIAGDKAHVLTLFTFICKELINQNVTNADYLKELVDLSQMNQSQLIDRLLKKFDEVMKGIIENE